MPLGLLLVVGTFYRDLKQLGQELRRAWVDPWSHQISWISIALSLQRPVGPRLKNRGRGGCFTQQPMFVAMLEPPFRGEQARLGWLSPLGPIGRR